MATSTFTSTLAGGLNQPKASHQGVNAVVVTCAGTVTGSATPGTTFRLCKLPDRATILGGTFSIVQPNGTFDVAVRVNKVEHSGTSSTIATLLASTSGSVTAKYDLSAEAGIGFQISLSDDLATKYVFVDAVVGAATSVTKTPSVKLLLYYLGNDNA